MFPSQGKLPVWLLLQQKTRWSSKWTTFLAMVRLTFGKSRLTYQVRTISTRKRTRSHTVWTTSKFRATSNCKKSLGVIASQLPRQTKDPLPKLTSPSRERTVQQGQVSATKTSHLIIASRNAVISLGKPTSPLTGDHSTTSRQRERGLWHAANLVPRAC